MPGIMIRRAAPAHENAPQQAIALSLRSHQPTELRALTTGRPPSYHPSPHPMPIPEKGIQYHKGSQGNVQLGSWSYIRPQGTQQLHTRANNLVDPSLPWPRWFTYTIKHCCRPYSTEWPVPCSFSTPKTMCDHIFHFSVFVSGTTIFSML